jgi:hypothetical protein
MDRWQNRVFRFIATQAGQAGYRTRHNCDFDSMPNSSANWKFFYKPFAWFFPSPQADPDKIVPA